MATKKRKFEGVTAVTGAEGSQNQATGSDARRSPHGVPFGYIKAGRGLILKTLQFEIRNFFDFENTNFEI